MDFDLVFKVMYNYTQNNHNQRRVTMTRFRARLVMLVLGLLVLNINTASADVYRVYLYYDHGQLFFDRGYDQKVVILRGQKISSNYPGGDYRVEVVDGNNVLHSAKFDPRPVVFLEPGVKVLDQGQTVLDLTYVPVGTGLKIYDPKDALILEYDISYLATCNLNRVCESFYGESISTCPQDCKEVTGGVAEQAKSDIPWVWWTVTFVGATIIVFFFWRWRQRKRLAVDQSPS